MEALMIGADVEDKINMYGGQVQQNKYEKIPTCPLDDVEQCKFLLTSSLIWKKCKTCIIR